MYDSLHTHINLYVCVCGAQLGVKALTVEDLLQAQKEISAHNRQLKEQTKQLERDMALLRDHSLLLVRHQGFVIVTIPCGSHLLALMLLCVSVMAVCCHVCYVKLSQQVTTFMHVKCVCLFVFQLKSRCEELKLDWGSLCLESLLKEKQALRRQISEKQRHCLELQVHTSLPLSSVPRLFRYIRRKKTYHNSE